MDIKEKRQRAANAVYILTAIIVVTIMCMSLYAAIAGVTQREDDGNEDVKAHETTAAPVVVPESKPAESSAAVVEETQSDAGELEVSAETEAAAEVIAEDTADVAASQEYETPLYVMPCSGVISKAFDDSVPVYSLTMGDYRVHTGIDITADEGSAVYACSAGVVSAVYDDPYMGQCIEIDHGSEITTLYACLSPEIADNIAVGYEVSCGELIATVGEGSGVEMADEPHLHFELKLAGVSADPLALLPYEVGEQITAYEDGQ